jgi:hypothetical protein
MYAETIADHHVKCLLLLYDFNQDVNGLKDVFNSPSSYFMIIH